MVVLAASICTKSGKPVVSRQFREMSRSRIESLLTSFPKLIPPSSQHTSVETADVRYVYQPLEDLYIVLITNKASNILQDIDTLHLLARVVSDQCRTAEQREISKKAFELMGAFDEIVSLGYREQLNLMQVRSVLEMESHEEKIQEIIARNKEAEAKEELKRRAKQLEMQRREQQRRAQGGGPVTSSGFLSTGSGGIGSYSPVPRYEAPSPIQRDPSPAPASLKPPAFRGSGMKLGSKKSGNAQLIDDLGRENAHSGGETPKSIASSSGGARSSAVKGGRGTIPPVSRESVHVQIDETVSLSLSREGGLTSMDLKGNMDLLVSDAANTKIQLAIGDLDAQVAGNLQFKQHPNVAKFVPDEDRVIAMKDPARGFPDNRTLSVLKWRYTGRDERWIPLSITCWPTPSGDGSCDVNIEYEMIKNGLELRDVIISVPLPSGSYPTVSSHSGSWTLNPSSHSLDWSLPFVSLIDESSQSGTLEFNVSGDDPEAFFPIKAEFVAAGTLSNIQVTSVNKSDTGASVTFSQDSIVSVADFMIT